MRPFSTVYPRKLAEALALKRDNPRLTVLAGGTDLITRHKILGPTLDEVLCISRVAELAGVRFNDDGSLEIGAGTTLNAVAHDDQLAAHPCFRALPEAARRMASTPVRNLGTIGGNIVNASPAADTAPPLLVLSAQAVVARAATGGNGAVDLRRAPLESFFTGPGSTTIASDEILTAFDLPAPAVRAGAAYHRLGVRQALDCAIVGVAALVCFEADRSTIADARIALGSVGPTPLLAMEAAAALVGHTLHVLEESPDEPPPAALSQPSLVAAADAATALATPIDDVRATAAYRKRMVGVFVRRAVFAAAQAALAHTPRA